MAVAALAIRNIEREPTYSTVARTDLFGHMARAPLLLNYSLYECMRD